LETLRQRKLSDLLEYCYRRIPYYQKIFREIGAVPGDFRRPEDLVWFPILEKETLRDQTEEFVDPDADRSDWIKYRSSGSTGIPLELWYTPQERLRMGFTVTRQLFHAGLKSWYRMVTITEPRHSAPRNRWYHRLGFMNEQFLSVYDKSALNLTRLLEIKPQLLTGFPSVLLVLGDELNKAKSEAWRPKLLFTLAEVLADADRRILKDQWGIEPIDLYGANEVGHIAFQCPKRSGYHINMDSVHPEILVGDKPADVGERGEVVVTNLDLRIMPIIRYRVGDVAQRIEGNCLCGCRFPMLGHVAGRSDGFIMNAEGKLFSALEVSLLLKPVKDVKQYRLLHEKEGQVRVQWVAAEKTSAPEIEICKILAERLGSNTQIETERVAEIPREKSGKIRTVISSLPNPFGRNIQQ
jgi:phenylacetate-CoA ligase